MSLRDYVVGFFERPKPDAREELNKAAAPADLKVAADKKGEDERKAAVEAKTAELLRANLTPERTPFGTQPKTPPTEKEARALAEKRVAAEAQKESQDRDGPGKAVKDDARSKTDTQQAAGQDNERTAARPAPSNKAMTAAAPPQDPLKGEEVTPEYIAEVVKWQAVHEVEGDQKRGAASWTPEERDALVAAKVAEIEAAQAREALEHSHTRGGGRTM